ncbi:LacI family DNA-binding transcriptional regulator [Roseomonas sp. SSH11]|uniref:LacI family DNA-binding transcriptional regulator n=1 Tax=Pararoseomonas baculiformis TaxID=2820812 RepID=A0ABS4AN86_9PROT|nr:LacI family DNA-binding transcriptional regulator [Pararoseomonas baculiformis]MBP0447699.1 LacI family DNA-binding transcriptional regulator [Pararoseomonas baculiformis]
MSDVAREAGVSPMSVSNAFKRPDIVLPATRERILAVARRLGYVPNRIAGTLASGRSHVVAAIVPSIRNSSFARTIQGLGDYLTEHGYELLLAVADTPERERRAIEAVLGRRPEGIVLTGNEHPPETLALLAGVETPVVETWILGDPIIDMAVGFSLADAGYAIGTFLTGRGYRHIGFAGYAPASQRRFLERQGGFQSALREAGLRDDLLFYAEEAAGFAGGRAAVTELLQREPRLDALFCVTDIFAAGALFECQRRGLSVPGQLAIAGFGDFEIAAEIVPALTTVRTRGYEIGQAAGRLLLDRAAGGPPGGRVNVGFELVSREST